MYASPRTGVVDGLVCSEVARCRSVLCSNRSCASPSQPANLASKISSPRMPEYRAQRPSPVGCETSHPAPSPHTPPTSPTSRPGRDESPRGRTQWRWGGSPRRTRLCGPFPVQQGKNAEIRPFSASKRTAQRRFQCGSCRLATNSLRTPTGKSAKRTEHSGGGSGYRYSLLANLARARSRIGISSRFFATTGTERPDKYAPAGHLSPSRGPPLARARPFDGGPSASGERGDAERAGGK